MERDYFVNICFEQNDNQVAGASQYSFDELPNVENINTFNTETSIWLSFVACQNDLCYCSTLHCRSLIEKSYFAIYTNSFAIVLGLLWLRFFAHATITNPFSGASAASL